MPSELLWRHGVTKHLKYSQLHCRVQSKYTPLVLNNNNNITTTIINNIITKTTSAATTTTGADAIKKFTPSLGIPYLGV